jgi:hypothetical protein
MNAYLILKFIHVAAAIAWLGGGGALVFAASISPTFEQRKAIVGTVTFLSKRLFIPSLVVVLLTGVALWWVGALAFEAWVAYGLAGILLTGGIGSGYLGPSSEKISTMVARNATQAELAPLTSKVLRVARADMVALASIVFVMVVKPTWADLGLLIGIIAVVAAGAAFFLLRPAKA